ncbi:Gfo/Idh/MocA family protein [Sphingomonas solaris]|uniref:Gfo/Idh/MocA family oxidoreductase n=1 Tax=Alterirhizorhabdus solaris TaxID=2529389 RepID=A0A558RBA4_9SPHN|nr:Gfo/Idh/MocA family oxidoreductase [Sphingomonas solaris]TVV76641.1 Gfo/Idh/MocA family oxidoreductase [Sphingomonas solaris]
MTDTSPNTGPNTGPLRIGFAGGNATRGWARDAHLPAIRALPGLAVGAVSARDQSLADEAAAVFGAPVAYGDTLAMVRDPGIDIVAVTVKVPEHRAIVLAAIAAGKHVYCEWPLGRDLAEAEELAAAARASDVHVAIGLQGTHAPAIRHAARLVREGAIGRPLNLRVVSPTAGWANEAPPFYAYLQDKRNGATLSSIAGGHTIAVIEAIVGPYADLSAINSILRDTVRISGTDEVVQRTCPDHVLAIGRHANGCVSSLEVLGGLPNTPFLFELRGTEGALTVSGHHAGGFQVSDLTVTATPAAAPQSAHVVAGLAGGPINVAESWAAFEADIRAGTRTVPDFETAVRLTRVLDAIDTAADTGGRVTIAD